MRRFRTYLILLGLLGSISGCGGTADTSQADPYALSVSELLSSANRLVTPAIDSTASAERARFAARRMREAGLMPVFASSFLKRFDGSGGSTTDPARAHVMGYVPGRNPSYAEQLVVLAADLDRAGAAVVLETARRLALEALDTQVPERTVLVTLWGPPRTGSIGVADLLAHPTWATDGIAHVTLVVSDPSEVAGGEAALAAQGIAVDVVLAPQHPKREAARETKDAFEAELLAFAETLYANVRAHALAVDSLAVDSLTVPVEAR